MLIACAHDEVEGYIQPSIDPHQLRHHPMVRVYKVHLIAALNLIISSLLTSLSQLHIWHIIISASKLITSLSQLYIWHIIISASNLITSSQLHILSYHRCFTFYHIISASHRITSSLLHIYHIVIISASHLSHHHRCFTSYHIIEVISPIKSIKC